MFSIKIKSFLYGAIVSASLISMTTYALSWPDGVFGDYFENMTGYCLSGWSNAQVLTGLAGNSDAPDDFGSKRCTSLKSLIWNIFGSTSAPDWQAIVGFKPDGSPLYGDVNWHNDGTNITYTGGKVWIGISIPAEKLDVAWIISSTSGWFKFPDGTIQTTATVPWLDTVIVSDSFTSWRWPWVSTSCPAGYKMTGGWWTCSGGAWYNFIYMSVPLWNGWFIQCDTPNNQFLTATVSVVCAR